MAELVNHPQRKRELDLLASDTNMPVLESVTKALSSTTRLEILRFLGAHTCSLSEISEALSLPQSTTNLHINILEKAGLIKTNLQPAKRGVQRVCARMYDVIAVRLPGEKEVEEGVEQISMPVGAFVDAEVIPTCGLLGEMNIIGELDNPAAFYEPDRIHAQLIWFRRGYVEYRFPKRVPSGSTLESLELAFESCSEAPLHHDDWPSDISVWFNGVMLGTWTSPADFGGERGVLTPLWWDNNNTQYGLLKVWRVNNQGSFVDGIRVSSITLDDLHIETSKIIEARIGIREDAKNIGGINLFGSKFGNYPQDLVMTQRYRLGE